MPWFHELLTSISRAHVRLRPRLAIRAVAAALSIVLLFGAVTPGFALAGEADSEQEGSAAPGALPGLEEGPELELGGEETVLESGAASGGGEGEEGRPLESEPAQEPEPPPPPAEAPPATAEAPPVSEEPPPAPTYTPAGEPAAQAAPPAPVENEPLTAPESPQPVPQAQPEGDVVEQAVPETPAPVSPPEAPEPAAAQPPAVPAGRGDVAGSLAGQAVHTVQTGECLWSIAEALLPAGADNAEIGAVVQRLWKLNAERIGTGDPSLLYAGTELRLR